MKNKNTKILTALFAIIISFIVAAVEPKNSYAEHSISMTASESLSLDVSNMNSGTAIGEAQVSVATTCQAGYSLTLSSTVDDNNLYLDGDSNNSSSGYYLAPSDGIKSLKTADNTWGFYLPTEDEVPTIDSVFSAVPTVGNLATLKTPAQTARGGEIVDNLSIYYGVKIARDTSAGQYMMKKDARDITGTIVYYATLPEDCFRYVIEYNPTGTSTGEEITGIGSIDDQIVAEGATINLTNEVYDNPTVDGVYYYFIGWNSAQDGSGMMYTSGQEVTDLATAGTTITLYAQWAKCPSGKICYASNNTDAEGEMGQQSANSNEKTILLASNYSLSGSSFVGWSEDEDAASKLAEGEDVTIYGPNETITTGDLSLSGLYLNAVWLESSGTLQEWEGCDDLEIGDVLALSDARDGNVYSVAKLADNRCWMIDNLRLESDSSVGEKALLSQGYDTSFGGLAEAENSHFADSSEPNSLYSTNGSTEITIGGDYISSRFPRYNNTNVQLNTEEVDSGSMNTLNYGNYYTWSAAIADTSVHYNQNTVVDTTSICPAGWRLPRGGDKSLESSNDYWELIVNGVNNEVKPDNYNSFNRPFYYGNTEGSSISEKLRKYPNNLLLSGYYNNNSTASRGVIGGYWTAVASFDNGAYIFSLGLNGVYPGTEFTNKYRGNSIRCIYGN